MKEYIEREKLIDNILHAILVVPSEDFLLPPEKDIVRMIKSEPAADAVSRDEYNRVLAENEKLKKKVASLQSKISLMKSSASWDEDIRRGQVQGMW